MCSIERKKYLKKIRKEKILVALSQLLILVSLIALWEYSAYKGYINAFIASSPSRIFKTIISLHNQGSLYNHIGITVYETFLSFIIGSILGTLIAIILWWNRFISKVIDPYLTILNSLPKVALGPIIIIFCGANMKSIIIMALLISVIVTIMTVYSGFESTDINKINLLKSFKARDSPIGKRSLLKNVTISSFFSGFKTS